MGAGDPQICAYPLGNLLGNGECPPRKSLPQERNAYGLVLATNRLRPTTGVTGHSIPFFLAQGGFELDQAGGSG